MARSTGHDMVVGYTVSELPIKDPKLIVERFMSQPLRIREHAQSGEKADIPGC